MASIFDFYPEKNYVEVAFTGDMTFEIMQTAFVSLINHPEFVKNINVILNFSGSGQMVSQADMVKFFSFQEDYESRRGEDYRVAVLCNDKKDFAQLKILADYTRAMPYEVMVFLDKAEALKWIFS